MFVWLSAGFDSWLTRCLSSSSSYSSCPGKSDVYNSDIYAAASVEYSFVLCHFLTSFLSILCDDSGGATSLIN
jgi:hypothetical protein